MFYEETNRLGSFAARGTGFIYDYDAGLRLLHISREAGCVPLATFGLDRLTPPDLTEFVRLFDKTTQIKALAFSNNTTVNLADTLDDSKLPAMLIGALRLSLYAFDLKKGDHEAFQEAFLTDHELARLKVMRFENYAGRSFYVASAEAISSGCKVTARSSALHAALAFLADKITSEIVAKEYGNRNDRWVQGVLNIATALSMLGFILNDRFEPAKKAGNGTVVPPPSVAVTAKNQIKSNI